MKKLIVLFLILSQTVAAQKLKKSEKAIVENLKAHLEYLASDKLEGRRTGTAGEKLANEYIIKEFTEIGLQPKGENNSYLQSFIVHDGKMISPASFLIINGEDLKQGRDFFPFPWSVNGSLEALLAVALRETNEPWLFNLAETLKENKNNPHFDLEEAIRVKAADASEKGATALIVYNLSDEKDNLAFNPKDNREISKIPVLYVQQNIAKKLFADESATLDMKFKVELSEKTRTGYNVIGYMDNSSPTTIILGAHYDHIGYGEDHNSRYTGEVKMIHNGADDNASGTAALIELARMLKSIKNKKNNYLFIAFSGEELGLYGSKYFAEHPTIDLTNADYMINMDMVGRLKDDTKTVSIGGIGTSPSWVSTITGIKEKYLNFTFDSSGVGPSDHTSFYRKDIPVLFFFTGQHPDYHKPTDDYDKINYTGELKVIEFIQKLVEETSEQPKLAFTKTREPQSTARSFNVSLGIMPDYTFSGSGIRVDGVTDGRPASKAGLKTGDIIVQLGDFKVNNMESYMQCLNKFNKGDKTKVTFKRGSEVQTADIQF